MGHKTNPIIFQIGKTKNWRSNYIEKKTSENATYTFKDFEIKKFIYKFFEDNGLILHHCKIFYSENIIYIYTSYFLSLKTLQILYQYRKKEKTQLKHLQKTSKNLKCFTKKKFFFSHTSYFKYLNKLAKTKKIKFLKSRVLKEKLKLYYKKYLKNKLTKVARPIKKAYKFKKVNKPINKFLITLYKFKNLNNIIKNSFLNNITQSIQLFSNKNTTVVLNIYQINDVIKNITKKQKDFIKKKIYELNKFSQEKFYRKGLQIILLSLKMEHSVEFLAKFIATELQTLKKHHFFLNFIAQSIKFFNRNLFCIPKDIVIEVNGRINGASKSKKRIIKIGSDISIISLDSNIEYFETTCFSINGTLGIKIWILRRAIDDEEWA
jgi:hypothetical protein